MTSSDNPREGGCLCGQVRYRTEGSPSWVLHCHCNSCRRQSSAPMVTWAGFHSDRFTWTASAPQTYKSSPGVERLFCGACGTPMMFRSERWADEAHIAVTTLDDPGSVTPKGHVHVAEKLAWMHLGDDLPQHDHVAGG